MASLLSRTAVARFISLRCSGGRMLLASSRRAWSSAVIRPLTLAHSLHNEPLESPTFTSKSSFSTAEEEAPLVPGIGKGKTSTGYVGLAVEPDWYNVLNERFQALLDRMEESDMPETAQYRIDVTKWCNYVMSAAAEHPDDPEAVEDMVRMGQVEELIEMAEDEMIALETYLSVRMWELVAEANPAVDFDPDPMQDPMGEDGDPAVAEALREGMEAMKQEKE